MHVGKKSQCCKAASAGNLADPSSVMMSLVLESPPLCTSCLLSLCSPSASSASAREPLHFTWVRLPLPPVSSSACSSTTSHLSRFGGLPPILVLFPEGEHACTPSPLAQETHVSAVSMVVSERTASSQPRSAEALNFFFPLIGSSLGLMSFQTTLQSSAFPHPQLLQACESVCVWEGGSCHCEGLFGRVGDLLVS